jgi:protein-tyrosine-phosphatase
MNSRYLILVLRIVALGALLSSGAWAQAVPGQGEIVFVCKHGNVKSLMATSYFNRLAVARGLPYKASARGSEVDTPEVPRGIATKLKSEGFDVSTFSASSVTAADLGAAKRVILIEVSLPTEPAGKVEHWDDVPPASTEYAAASAALKTHIEKLLDQLQP